MGLADCRIVGLKGVSCARELKVEDFRVLRALTELHARRGRVTVENIVDYLDTQRSNALPCYDEKVVADAIKFGLVHNLICAWTKLKPTRGGEELVHLTLTNGDPELSAYRVWSSKIGAMPVAAVVAG